MLVAREAISGRIVERLGRMENNGKVFFNHFICDKGGFGSICFLRGKVVIKILREISFD